MKIRKLSLLAITLMSILSGTVACVDVPNEEEVRDAIGAGDRDGDEGRRNARREDGREDEEMTDEDGDGLFAEDDADDDGDGELDTEE